MASMRSPFIECKAGLMEAVSVWGKSAVRLLLERATITLFRKKGRVSGRVGRKYIREAPHSGILLREWWALGGLIQVELP